MNNWKHRFDLSDFFTSDLYSLEVKAKKIKRRAEESAWYVESNYNGELAQLLEELVDAGEEKNVEHFDAIMDFLYDIFDADRILVQTR